jgi:hypothetical protein
MDTLDTKRTEMFIRVFENRAEFALAAAEGLNGAGLFDQLGQVIDDVRSSAYDQSRSRSSVRESTGSAAAARDELERQMDAIRRTVRVMGGVGPGLEEKFPSPRGLSAEALLTLARTYGNHAFPLKEQFVKRGLGADFIADLDAAAVALDATLKERTKRRGRQLNATAEIDKVIDRGLKTVRELDVIVRNIYANDPAKLALWESVSHVEKLSHRPRRKTNGDSPAPPTQS